MARIVAYIILLTSVFTVTEACKCALVHPQTSFCIADFGTYLNLDTQYAELASHPKHIFQLKIVTMN